MDRLKLTACVLALTFIISVNGLSVNDVKEKIKSVMQEATYRDYYNENIITVASWSINHFSTADICKYILQLKPKIVGLQDVGERQLTDFARCLSGYKYYAGIPDSTISRKYNPIFYISSRYIQIKKKGTFWLSKTPHRRSSSLLRKTRPRICTWVKITIAEMTTAYVEKRGSRRNSYRKNAYRRRDNHNKKISRILSLLQKFTNKKADNDGHRRVSTFTRRRQFIWRPIYIANTQLENVYQDVAVKQMEILKEHFQTHATVMDRRRYPLIFMGDLGWNYDSSLYQKIDDQNWLIDARKFAAKSFPLETHSRGYSMQNNYIMQNSLKSLLFATLYNSTWPGTTKLPVFAAYLTEKSPKKPNNDRTRNSVVTRRN